MALVKGTDDGITGIVRFIENFGFSERIEGAVSFSDSIQMLDNPDISGIVNFQEVEIESIITEKTPSGIIFPVPVTSAHRAMKLGAALGSIPSKDVKDLWVRWALNEPVTFGATVNNWSKAYHNILKPALSGDPNFITITLGTNNGTALTFPEMAIIKQKVTGYLITIEGVCSPGIYLYDKINLEGYTTHEGLKRKSETEYEASGITGSWNSESVAVINHKRSTGSFAGKTFTPSSPVEEEDAPVFIVVPLKNTWILKNLMSKLSGNNYSINTKNIKEEYIHTNFIIRESPAINIIQQIAEAVNAEFYFQPSGGAWELVLIEKDNPISSGSGLKPKHFLKGGATVDTVTVNQYNTVSVISPAVIPAPIDDYDIQLNESEDGRIFDFKGEEPLIESIQIEKVHEVGLGGSIEFVSWVGQSGGNKAKGAKYNITINTENPNGLSDSGENVTTTVEESAITVNVSWSKTDVLDVLSQGINEEVVDQSHLAKYGEIRAADINNSAISSTATAMKIGKQAIEESKKNQKVTGTIPPMLTMKPGRSLYIEYPFAGVATDFQIQAVTFSNEEPHCSVEFKSQVAP